MTKDFQAITKFLESKKAKKLIARRHRKEKIFKNIGLVSIIFSITFLALLITDIASKSSGAFTQTKILFPIHFEEEAVLDDNYRRIFNNSIKQEFPTVNLNRKALSKYRNFFSKIVIVEIKDFINSNPKLIGKTEYIWLSTSSSIDQYIKGNTTNIRPFLAEMLEDDFKNYQISKKFSFNLLSNGDSTSPEIAGIGAALLGTIYTMLIFLMVSFPLAVMLALYLEEFAAKNKFTDFIEVNINNLAAIPSIIFGLLGLSIFISFFNFPRSSALVGGFTLSLMVLPTIVIATRNSIKAIPQNIKDASLALGASKIQVALHYTLPLAFPGIITGTILAIARAIGETAPLLMIGMVAFIVDKPQSFTDPTTVLPVQIYLWSNNPELGFVEKTSATILILLSFLITINIIAIFLRNKYAKKW